MMSNICIIFTMSTNAFYEEYESYTQKSKKIYGENAVVFLQCGMFYEMYCCTDEPYKTSDTLLDIRKIAELLDLSVTKKNKNIPEVSKSNCLMAGFPVSSHSKYICLLTRNNYTVIVVSQVTPAPNPKREITGIYSAGTTMDDVVPAETNYVMTLFCEEVRDLRSQKHMYSIGIAYLDVSTGVSYAYETSSKPDDIFYALDEAYRVIVATNPKEILIMGNAKTLTFDDIVTHLEISNRYLHDWFNKESEQIREIQKIRYQTQLLRKVFPDHGLM